MENSLVLKGLVQRSYTIAADPAVCYEYLSDLKNLLTQVPHVTKVQIGKTSGKARALRLIRCWIWSRFATPKTLLCG
jgi:hypothetical protein